MHLLDTDTFTLLYHGNDQIVTRLAAAGPMAITIITRIEVLQGRFAAIMKAANQLQLLQAQQRLVLTEAYLLPLEVVPVDEAAAAWFDRLCQEKKLRKIGRGDLLIASIALARKATLVTRNLKDFQVVPGLRVENWAD